MESYRLFRPTMALSTPSWQKTRLRFAAPFLTLAKQFPCASICEAALRLFPSHLAFLPSFHAAFIDSPPRRHLPWSPGSSFLAAQKTPVTDCLPPVRLRISRAITLSCWCEVGWIRGLLGLRPVIGAAQQGTDASAAASASGLTSGTEEEEEVAGGKRPAR